jgi:hypothetical protein
MLCVPVCWNAFMGARKRGRTRCSRMWKTVDSRRVGRVRSPGADCWARREGGRSRSGLMRGVVGAVVMAEGGLVSELVWMDLALGR